MKVELSKEGWEAHMRAWEKSQLSQKEYCKRHELKLATFGRWRKRLRESSTEGLSFINVGSRIQEETASGKMVMQLLLPNGVHIGLNEDIGASLLQQILHFAGEL